MGLPTPFQTLGPHMVSGSNLNNAIAAGAGSYTDGITALANGGQTGATLLVSRLNNVKTVANANDSCMLPTSSPGAIVIIINNGANAMQLFANTVSALASGVEDTINGTAGATGISISAAHTAFLFCTAAGAWVGPVGLA